MTELVPPPVTDLGPQVVHVIVPARDEADLLPRCLAALAVARRRLARTSLADVRVTVVLDSCVDGSAAVLARHPWVEVVDVRAGSAAAARAAGVAHARTRAAGTDPVRVWLAHTDADSVVPPHWLEAQVGLAERGFALVTGTVRPDPGDLGADLLAAWTRRHHEVDGHPHVHGANLGLTLASYDAVGGFRDLDDGEDVRLVDDVRRGGWTTWASAGHPVVTSGRRTGRARLGFAGYLRSLTPD